MIYSTLFSGLTPKLTRTPGSASTNATPYTPGGTPHSIITDIDMTRLTPLSVSTFSRGGTPSSKGSSQLAAVQQQQQMRPPNQQQYGNQQWNSYGQQYQDQQYSGFSGFSSSSRESTPQRQQQQQSQQQSQQYVR